MKDSGTSGNRGTQPAGCRSPASCHLDAAAGYTTFGSAAESQLMDAVGFDLCEYLLLEVVALLEVSIVR
jgi:hypothetical protein